MQLFTLILLFLLFCEHAFKTIVWIYSLIKLSEKEMQDAIKMSKKKYFWHGALNIVFLLGVILSFITIVNL